MQSLSGSKRAARLYAGLVTDYWNPEQHAASDDFCQPL
jgi:hypothetical protein